MNDDLISRQAVIDILEKEGHKWGNDYRDWIDAIEEIKKLPPKDRSVQDFVDKCRECGKQKTGHWIKYGVPRCGEQHYKCTSCGYYINFGQWGELYTKEFKYCPNCGAKMVEPQESEGV